ncbi:hypothetical protein CsSME_00014327 [Camellia sinensis var. sinensis]
MFYWGGKILRNRDEGVSYNTEPQGLYNVHRGITLGKLEAMMVPKNVDGYYSAGAGPSAPITYNPMVLTTPYPHWNEECPSVCNVQCTMETVVQNYASSDDTVPLFDEVGVSDEDSVKDVDGAWEGADNDSGDDEVGGHHDM